MFENVMKLSTTSCKDDDCPFKVINWEKNIHSHIHKLTIDLYFALDLFSVQKFEIYCNECTSTS